MTPAAEIFAVGSELLLHGRQDSNSPELASLLTGMGFEVRRRQTLGDALEELRGAFREAAARADLVLATGGLGPTADDRTRDALAAAFGRTLREDPALVADLERRFRSRGRPMARSNLRQAQVPEGAEVLHNPLGTAPGLWLAHPGGVVALLPGPPAEMRAVLDRGLREKLRGRFVLPRVARRALLASGIGESDLEDRIADLYHQRSEVEITVLSSPGLVELLLLARHRDPGVAEDAVAEVASAVEARLDRWIFAREETTLAAYVGERLRLRGARLAVAESCTAGLLAADLTRTAGSSAYFAGGIVAYANEVKRAQLEVAEETLARHGAVSEEVAREMAEGVRRRFGVEFGLAITGVAGPGGGTPEKPVGTVWLAA
ncbi:MAG: CinA family nicotinamide mononucleotide deamidase-related protein, partial [Acidobacteriota bacterium]